VDLCVVDVARMIERAGDIDHRERGFAAMGTLVDEELREGKGERGDRGPRSERGREGAPARCGPAQRRDDDR